MHSITKRTISQKFKKFEGILWGQKLWYKKNIQILHDTIDCQKCKDTQKKRNMVQRLSRETLKFFMPNTDSLKIL